MTGASHAKVGATAGFGIALATHAQDLFAKALAAVHPFGFLGASHPFAPAAQGLATLTLPVWLSVPFGFVLAYGIATFYAAAFALLPDIDSPASTYGQCFPRWARWVAHMKHRGETHWLATGLLVVGVVALCSSGGPFAAFFPLLAAGGYLIGHLFCDLITEEGLVLFGPFSRAVIRLPFGRLETGGPVEPFVAYVICAVILLWSTGLLGHLAVALHSHSI